MHGQNPVRKQENREDDKLQIAEVFYTLQGEGPFAGEPATFIRLTGCNLRCWFCDTVWDDVNDAYKTPYEILETVAEITPGHCSLVVITGGEPLRQQLAGLFTALWSFDSDLRIQVETAGTYWQDILRDPRVTIVVSPKTPRVHPTIAEHADAYKYVIQGDEFDPVDGLPLLSTQIQGQGARLARPHPRVAVYLSPCDEGADNPIQTAANHKRVAELSMAHGYRAGVQLHKVFDLR